MLLLLAATPKKRGMDPQNGSKRAGNSVDVLNVSSCISAECSPVFHEIYVHIYIYIYTLYIFIQQYRPPSHIHAINII